MHTVTNICELQTWLSEAPSLRGATISYRCGVFWVCIYSKADPLRTAEAEAKSLSSAIQCAISEFYRTACGGI